MMVKKIIFNPLLWIFLLALLLRIIALSEIPAGFHVDEVKAGWNAYSILKTGRDDWGNFLPMSYDSFGDFRPTGIMYSIIPAILVFGLNEFAVRFPSAFFGALSIIPLFYFTKYLQNKSKPISQNVIIPYLASFLLSVSPWHISLSRTTSESIISLFLTLTGLVLFIIGLRKKNWLSYLLALICLATAYLFYHSSRLLIPIFTIIIFAYELNLRLSLKTDNLKKIFSAKFAIAIVIILILITAFFATQKEATSRFRQVSIFSDLNIKRDLDLYPFELGQNRVLEARIFFNKPLTYTRRFIEEYARYFSTDFFLVYGTAKPVRYQTAGMGLLTYAGFVLLILGLISFSKKHLSILPVLLLIITPLPAALTTEDAPNLNRAVFMIPFLEILMAYGLFYIYKISHNFRFILPITLVLFTFNFAFFLEMYFFHNPVHAPIPYYRNATSIQVALKITELQNKFDKILVTNIPDSIYPWYAFYSKQDPAIFNGQARKRHDGVWQYQNIFFSAQRCPSRDAYKFPSTVNVLAIDGEGCASDAKYPEYISIKEEVKRPDNSVTNTIWVEDKKMRKLFFTPPEESIKD